MGLGVPPDWPSPVGSHEPTTPRTMQWQPIETAPRPPLHDTSVTRYVLGFCPCEDFGDKMRVIWWEPNIGGGQWYDDRDIPGIVQPSHWMPLPPPPST